MMLRGLQSLRWLVAPAIFALVMLTALRKEYGKNKFFLSSFLRTDYRAIDDGVLSSAISEYDPKYFNTNRRLDGEVLQKPAPFSSTGYSTGGPVIAALVTNRQKDIDELCLALRTLAFLRGDDPNRPTPVLVFNEGDLTTSQMRTVIQNANRPISFPLVDFSQFPEGFDPNGNDADKFLVKGRSRWGYFQMIRFWITGIWKHPALEPYETVMRIDSDSCFEEPNSYLPNFMYDHLVYHCQYVGFEDGKEFTEGLIEFAEKFMEETNKMPGNPLLWQFIKSSMEAHETLPVFMTNMEVSRKSWMQRPDVMNWHEALTEREPFGIFRYRWGDAVTRVLTAAIFARSEHVMTSRADGYRHKDRCVKEELEKRLAQLA